MDEKQDLKNQFHWALRNLVGSDRLQLVRKIDLGFNEVGLVYEVIGTYWHPQPMRNVNLSKINAKSKDHDIDWDIQPLGKIPDDELANELGISPETVTRARKKREVPAAYVSPPHHDINWSEQPLGQEFDSVIAERLGVDVKIVSKARNDLKIPRRSIDWDEQPLGKVSDRELAERLGVDRSSVSRARRARGILAKTVKKRPKPKKL